MIFFCIMENSILAEHFVEKNKLRHGHLSVDITIFSKQSFKPSRKLFANEYIKTHVNFFF